jgi:hypothetical protein
VSVALIPLCLAAVSVGSLYLFRYTHYGTDPDFVPLWPDGTPFWALAVQSLVCIAVVWAPCATAIWWGRRAARSGDPRGRPPQVVAIVAGVGYALLSLGSLVPGAF